MNRDGFKEAEMIELYDAGVVLHPKRYSASAGWRDSPGESYCIEGRTIEKFMGLFGVQRPLFEKPDAETGGITKCLQRVPDLPIFRRPMEIGDGSLEGTEAEIILKLWANIEQPQLLHVRIRSVCDVMDSDKKYYDQDFSYSGRFNVWWVMYDQEQFE